MEQETLIYIEEKDKNEAAKLAGGFTLEDTMKRAYINALGSELAMKYLAQEEINVSNIYNLHNIYKIREEFDIADIMLPNIHIDVRMIYDNEYIFIPKTHFEYGLTPDIYLVFQMLDDESCVKFLGFFEPKLINKNNHNDKYYFIEKEKLSHPSDLKAYIENFNGNTTEALSTEDYENGQKLAMSLIDHDITDNDKRQLLKMLIKCSALREDLIEFDNFEWVSYHVATNEDLTYATEITDQYNKNVQDEFDIFEQADEFETDDDFNENLTDENLTFDEDTTEDFPEDNLLQALSDDESDIESTDDNTYKNTEIETPEDTALETEQDKTYNTENDIPEIDSSEELSDDNAENAYNQTDISDGDVTGIDLPEAMPEGTLLDAIPEVNIDELPDNLSLEEPDSIDEISEELPPQEDIEKLSLDTINETADLENEFVSSPDETFNLSDLTIDESEINTDEQTSPEDTTVEKIHLSEFNELPFDTGEQTSDEEIEEFNEPETLADDADTTEEIQDLNTNESPELINFENLEERDDIKPLDEEPFKDNEITSLDTLETVNETPEVEKISNDTTSFDNLELPQDSTIDYADMNNDISETISLSDLDNLSEEITQSDNSEEISEQPVSLEELSISVPETPAEVTTDDFLETLASDNTSLEDTAADETAADRPDDNKQNLIEAETADTEEIVSYENSTVINNQVDAPGEFNIDINQPVEKSKDNDIEKLEILYNENQNFEDNENNLQFKAALPEKGKKAIALATIVVAALASLLIYAAMNKSENKIAEQNNTSILEKNLPKLDEQEIPQENTVLPAKTNTKPKLEDMAKDAEKNVTKPKAPIIETPYLDVKKLSWLVPDYVSYNDDFKKYLQTAGKSLKLSLSSDLLLATEYAYSDQIQVNIVLSKEGTIQNAKILQSSGSTQIDDIVLRTVNDTLKVVKAPAGVIVGDSIQLTLKIYL